MGKKWTGENRRKSEMWKLLFVVGGVSAVSVATGYAAHPNIPEPVEVEPPEVREYVEEFDSTLSQLFILTAREPEVRTVIIYRDTGSTIYDSIPYPVPSPPEIVRVVDSIPYPVPGPIQIVSIPTVQRSRWPTNIALTLGGGILGVAIRSLFVSDSDTTLGRRPCAADRPKCND